MKKAVVRAWDYMGRLGLLEKAKQIDINDHINTDLYKAALDECQKQYGQDNPQFYEGLQAQYARNNQ
jgi:NitT/TauT family transport system substrate-binding protein